MSAVPLQKVIAALRGPVGAAGNAYRKSLADRIEQHGIAPPDGRTPVAWAIDTPHGRGYSFAEELLDSYPVPDGMVLVRKEPVAWRHWHPIELCFEYHLQPVCDRCDALYIAAAPEVKP